MKTPSCKVVVPVYKQLDPCERVILAHNSRILRNYPFVIIGPAAAISEIKNAGKVAASEGVDVSIQIFPDADFANISGYNRLLKSQRFLYSFKNVDFVLICQLDAVILRDELEKWLLRGYHFIGAPHFKGYVSPQLPPRFVAGANGGLSLRNIAASMRALNNVRIVNKTSWARLVDRSGLPNFFASFLRTKIWVIEKENINEDIFWSVVVPSVFSTFRVPPSHIAAEFAFETLPQYLFEMNSETLPFGCHAWKRYDMNFWIKNFPENLRTNLEAALDD